MSNAISFLADGTVVTTPWLFDVNTIVYVPLVSIVTLRAALKTGPTIYNVLGYHTVGDGGGGIYWYDSTDTSTADNGGTVIVASDGGRWKLVVTNSVSVRQFGAYGDNSHDDTAAIQSAINWVQLHTDPATYATKTPYLGTVSLQIPAGWYLTSAPLTITRKITIFGDGSAELSGGSRLVSTVSGDLLTITPIAAGMSFGLRDITLVSTVSGTGQLVNFAAMGANSNRFTNVCFCQPQQFAVVLRGDDTSFTDCVWDVSGFTGNSIQLGGPTVGDIASNVRFTNPNWFNCPTRIFLAYRYRNVEVVGGIVSQFGGSNTLYFLDAANVPASQAESFSATGVKFETVRTIAYLGSACTNTSFVGCVGFSLVQSGEDWIQIGTGGTVAGLTIVGNRASGSWGSRAFYSDGGFAVTDAKISDNNVTASSGTGQAFVCGNTVGEVRDNQVSGFTLQSVGEKRSSTGAPYSPGLITAGTAVVVTKTITGAALGDQVNFTPSLGAWPVVVGIEMRGYVSAANTAAITYRNYTAGSLTPSAHDLVLEVSR